MGTDRLLWSVPDFRITNNQQRTTNNLSYHPTLVLAQRVSCSLERFGRSSFPSHIGSRSTSLVTASGTYLGFPSHIGSRSTYIEQPCERKVRSVSIPHWFSLNHSGDFWALSGLVSFHPTLVLAQPRSLLEKRSLFISFHPTLVLAQRIV